MENLKNGSIFRIRFSSSQKALIIIIIITITVHHISLHTHTHCMMLFVFWIVLLMLTCKAGGKAPQTLTPFEDDIAQMMGFQESQQQQQQQQQESSRNLRFTSRTGSESSQSWRFIAKFPRCGHWAFFGADGPNPVVPDGGCCPLEGFLSNGQSCSGHGTCIVDPMAKPNPLSFLEEDETEDEIVNLDQFTIRLTQKEQRESLGGNWAKLIEEAKRKNNLKCQVKLKKEYSAKICKKDETWGCVDDGENDKIWVREGCAGEFENKGVRLKCSATEKSYGECGLFPGIHCQKGQGEKNEKKIVKTENVKTRLDCAKKCAKNKDCIAFDFAKGLKNKNCRLYAVNTPRIGIKADTGGLAQYRYCVLSPERRNDACGKKKICAKCQCDTGWGGVGCETNLASSNECSPLEPGCIKLPPKEPPCYGQFQEFPLMNPCRNPNREHVPRPPEQPPLLNGKTPSYKDDQTPEIWKEEEKKSEGGEEPGDSP